MMTNDPRHGTRSTYTNNVCRCDLCRVANRDYMRRLRDNLKARTVDGDEPWHGTFSGYANWGCRCDLCKAANAKKMREYWREFNAKKATK
jgi:hypothetical protein